MKAKLNAAVRAAGMKVDEEMLFRELAKEFNTAVSRATYVEEMHKNMIEFGSGYKVGGVAKVELGDLMLLTYDKATNELRLCILQAKHRKGRYYRFLNFNANIFQWELLKDKPMIINRSKKFDFPTNILNFRTDYESITAYGIFYEDNISGEIDFLYTLPKYIVPKSIPKKKLTKGVRMFHFSCPRKLGASNSLCRAGITCKEAVSTCSLDVFEAQVLRCKVGAPIDDTGIRKWIANLLLSCRGRATAPGVIDEVLAYLDVREDNVESKYDLEGVPSVIVVATDSERAEERFSDEYLLI